MRQQSRYTAQSLRIFVGFACVLCVCLLCLVHVSIAFADEDEQSAEMQALERDVSNNQTAYEEALADVEELEQRIAENEERIAELEAMLPAQREVTSAAIANHYKLQQESSGLLVLLLSCEDFNEFITLMNYLAVISSKSTLELQELIALQTELEETKVQLESDKAEADQRLADAEEALRLSQEAAEAQALAEAQEAAAALAAALEAANEQATSSSGNSFSVQVADGTGLSEVDWSVDRDTFVAEWTGRIDAYLAGSALAGYGYAFAEAAYDCGVDPRWSPAISCIESSKGAVCFLPYNAWGWGSSSWSDWDTAIRAHVSGLASIYGYTITLAAAKMYCPPNYQYWYSSVLSEMQRI